MERYINVLMTPRRCVRGQRQPYIVQQMGRMSDEGKRGKSYDPAALALTWIRSNGEKKKCQQDARAERSASREIASEFRETY